MRNSDPVAGKEVVGAVLHIPRLYDDGSEQEGETRVAIQRERRKGARWQVLALADATRPVRCHRTEIVIDDLRGMSDERNRRIQLKWTCTPGQLVGVPYVVLIAQRNHITLAGAHGAEEVLPVT